MSLFYITSGVSDYGVGQCCGSEMVCLEQTCLHNHHKEKCIDTYIAPALSQDSLVHVMP